MKIKSDILIIGSGIAGLSAALKLSERFNITLITKKEAMEANTRYAQGGIASVMSATDNYDSHIKDTLECGSGLCNLEVVESIVRDGPRLIRELIGWGVEFTRSNKNEYDLGREGGHSERRVLHAGDITGFEVETSLLEKAQKNPNIKIYEHFAAIDLILSSKVNPSQKEKHCLGAYVLDVKNKQIITCQADVTILATGGAGKSYLYTSNPDVATGDGIAMAYRAGAAIANLEFVQFHPTCLYHPGAWSTDKNSPNQEDKSFLISEAVRGEGAILKTIDGEPFMQNYHPMKDLGPRDIVARAIDNELKKRGDDYVLLDLSHHKGSFIRKRFPNIYKRCLQAGFDMRKEPIPVVPAAHYFCGGIQTDLHGKTSIPGVFAIGETACTGLHGANRLASNSLLEALAMSDYAAKYIMNHLPSQTKISIDIPDWNPGGATDSDDAVVINQNWDEIRRLLWNYVGIVRSDKRLMRAKRRIDILQEEIREYYWHFTVTLDLIELRNLARVAGLIIQSAMQRKESRGLHYNIDYPEAVEAEKKDTVIQKSSF